MGLFGQMFSQIGELYSSFNEVYGMLTRSEEYVDKVRKENEKYGVYRSGEGTPEERMQR